jgi:hypothetical protein
MKVDEIDIAIIRVLHGNANLTTYDIAKIIFGEKNHTKISKQDVLIRHRMTKLVENHLVLCSNTKPKTYNANPENVFTGMGTFEVKVNGGKTLELDFGEFLVVKDSESVYFHKIKGGEDIRVMT